MSLGNRAYYLVNPIGGGGTLTNVQSYMKKYGQYFTQPETPVTPTPTPTPVVYDIPVAPAAPVISEPGVSNPADDPLVIAQQQAAQLLKQMQQQHALLQAQYEEEQKRLAEEEQKRLAEEAELLAEEERRRRLASQKRPTLLSQSGLGAPGELPVQRKKLLGK